MFLRADSRVAEFRRGHARYVPTGRLAAGGMAEVWRGTAEFADGHVQPIAIKRVLGALADNALYRRMLEDEARLGMLLRHPNIVRVFDAREVRGSYILIMELVDGPSLRELLAQLRARQLAVPPRAALYIARELAQALAYAHEAIDEWGRDLAIVHRDVSPHNLLVGSDGSVKLMDFGLANSSSNLAEREQGMIGGKFGYVSPELVLRQEVTHLLDIFALGVVLWECLTGQRLFQAADEGETLRKVARCEVPPASSLNPEVTAELDQVLDGLLAPDPRSRYQRARDLLEDLDYVMAQLGPGDAARETAGLVRALGPRHADPRAGMFGSRADPRTPQQTDSLSRSGGSLPRAPLTSSGTHAIAAALREELELFVDEPASLP